MDTKILKKYDYYLNVLMNQLKFSDLVLIKIHLNILFWFNDVHIKFSHIEF